MECIILAGGFGTRLRPVTDHIPKPIIPLLNKPMIMHIIDSLPLEIDRVILAVNYKKEMLEEFFRRQKESSNPENSGPEIVFVEEKEPLGTGGAIKNCESMITGTFMVFNGDVIQSMDPSQIIGSHRSRKGIGTLAVWEVEDPTRYGIIGYDADLRIERFLEKPKPEEVFSNFINAGSYVLEQDIFDHIPGGRKVSIEREVYPFILDHGLFAYPFNGYWVDAGTREDFLRASSIMMDYRNTLVSQGEGNYIHPDAKILPPVTLGSDCSIANAVIGPNVVIGDRARIDRDVRIENATLLNDLQIKRGSVVQDSILGDGVVLEERTVVEGKILD
jgi:mannose-1-phosphate guanylyltransferase